jgi:hypothetical protein
VGAALFAGMDEIVDPLSTSSILLVDGTVQALARIGGAEFRRYL